MSDWKPSWNITSIPDPLFQSEVGRRRREKGGNFTPRPPKLKLCANGCGTELNATQRRSACPGCGYIHPRR
jgi:hypothetical protein